MHTPHIVLFSEDVGDEWHSGSLIKALEHHGVRVTRTSLTQCAFDTTTPTGLSIPGFDNTVPDGAFVRAVGTGTFEQVTLRLGILHALEATGICVWNTATAIERCVDKATAIWRFQYAGLPVPQTHTSENLTATIANFENPPPGTSAQSLIVKPLFGSQGNGITRITAPSDLPAASELGGVYHIQQFHPPTLGKPFCDYRVLVSGSEAICAMKREASNWRTNIHQGGQATQVELTADMAHLAVQAAHAVGAHYCGVDMIQDANGQLHLLEANSNPAWKGLQTVNPEIDIADRLARDFLASRRQAAVRQAFETACENELTALKPGNVHVFAAGHDMTVTDFKKSAKAAAPHIAKPHAPVGQRIASAAAATFAAVGCNTNLGILLLCAPLAAAVDTAPRPPKNATELRIRLQEILKKLSLADAIDTYTAIRLLNPAGLGSSGQQDVSTHPTLPLGEAMALAAQRDRIAQAYTDGYSEIFEMALPALAAAGTQNSAPRDATTQLHMQLLAANPDSHIVRKYGLEAAKAVQQEAANIDKTDRGKLLAFDKSLKQRRLNPGTTADLVVATLFAAELLQPDSGTKRTFPLV